MSKLKNKNALLRDLNSVVDSANHTLESIYLLRTKSQTLTKADDIINLIHFLITYIQDVAISLGLYLKCKNDLEKKFLARSLSVVCNQFFDEYDKLKGKNIRKAFIYFPNSITLFETELNLFEKELKLFRRKYEYLFRRIRNNSFAHRSIEILEYHKFYNNINPEEIIIKAA